MKIIFRCEECGKEYTKLTQASECEQGHKVKNVMYYHPDEEPIPNVIVANFYGVKDHRGPITYRREM